MRISDWSSDVCSSDLKPLRILFATGHGYLPQRVGGSETSSHELILALQEQGHHCAVLSALQGTGWLAFRNRVAMKLTRRPLIPDRRPGHRVPRAWFPDRPTEGPLPIGRASCAARGGPSETLPGVPGSSQKKRNKTNSAST